MRSKSRVVHKSSLTTCWTALAKTIIGVGLLALPFALQKCGWVIGMSMFFIAFGFALLSLHLLNLLAVNQMKKIEAPSVFQKESSEEKGVTFEDTDPLVPDKELETTEEVAILDDDATQLTDGLSYYAIAKNCAPSSRIVLDLSVAVNCIGVAIGYIQVAGDAVVALSKASYPDIDVEFPFLRCLVCLTAIIIVSPGCYLKRISYTKFINIGGLICILFLVICGMIFFDASEKKTTTFPPHANDTANLFVDVVSQWPVFIFAFTCHQNLLLVAEDLERPTVRRLDIVAYGSQGAALLLFLPAMIFPYITYGEDIQDKFLNNFPQDSVFAIIGRVCVIIAELFALALQVFPARKSITVLMEMAAIRFGGDITSGKRANITHYGITTAILAIVALVSMLTSNLHTTFTIVGLLASNTMSNLMPSFLYMKTFSYEENRKLWVLSLVFFVVTTLMIPISLTAIFMDLLRA